MRERVLHNTYSKRAAGAENVAVRYARKTLRSLRKNALKVIRTARSSRKDVIKVERFLRSIWVVSRKFGLSSHIYGAKGFLFCKIKFSYKY